MTSADKNQSSEAVDTIKIGISSCLLGNPVRYDGGHQHDHFLTDTLGNYVSFVPVCPEVECGMPVPREALRLVGSADNPRLVTIKTKQDYTRRMNTWARKRVRELAREDLCGFIFKSRSPSSGMQRVKVYNEQTGIPVHNGTGVFARAFMERFPLVPVEEDGRLHDPVLRDNFIERIFVYRRWRLLRRRGCTAGSLVAFHTSHKLLLLAHSPRHYRQLGKLVAELKALGLPTALARYETGLMEALQCTCTIKKHTNVLQHMMGYFKNILSADEKQELLETISNYHSGYVPLVVPITLLNHYVRKHSQTYLQQQHYLMPHPIELQLRNHV